MKEQNMTENTYIYSKNTIFISFKRIFDVITSILALVILSPVLLIIMFLIILEDGKSPFFVQERIGLGGKAFKLYKFRSMKQSDKPIEALLTPEQLAEYKRSFKLENDMRITRIGKLLRKTSLDELPQLINIIKGDMSIVGPRPVLQEETYLYGENRNKLLSVKPGLTGYWQAYARNAAEYENGERQRMELYYIDNMSVWLDVKIVFKTVEAVIKKTGK